MPRKARINAPGAVQHIIIRGSERKNIFRDVIDKEAFIELITKARAVLCYLCVRELRLNGAEVARCLNISPSTVSKAVPRGKEPVEKEGLINRLLKC